MEVHVAAGLIILKNSCKNWRCHKTRVQHNRRIICCKSLSPKSYAEVFKCFHSFLDHAFQHLSDVTATLASAKGQLKTQMLEILILCGTYTTGIIMFGLMFQHQSLEVWVVHRLRDPFSHVSVIMIHPDLHGTFCIFF